MSDETTTQGTRRRRPPMRGALPGPVISSGHNRSGPPKSWSKYPVRGRLSPQAGDVLALLVRPRSMLEVADALGIESPLARHHLDALERRGLVEQVGSYPTRWGAA